MPNKPVISIDIDDSQFKDFYALFQSFEEKLDKLPEGWKQVGNASNEANESLLQGLDTIVDLMVVSSGHAKELGQYLHEATMAQKEFGSASGQGAKHMKSMADDAKQLGQEVFGIGKYLFKIGAIGVGTVAGSLFGIDKLADAAVSNQRNARTLGLTTGQYRAFDTDLGRYIDPGTLSSVADAQKDLSKQWALARATGLSPQAIQGMDAGSLSAQLALKAHDWFTGNPGANDVQHFAATGFGQAGLDYDSVRRQGNTPRSELEQGLNAYQKDSRSLNYGAGAVDALYDFSNKLKLAGQHLETDLADKLSQLNKSGALSSFITSLEKDAEILINGVLTPANMNAAQQGLTALATYLGSADFKASVIAFAGGVKDMTAALASFLGWIRPFLPITPDPNAPPKHYLADPVDKAAANAWDWIKSGTSSLYQDIKAGRANNPGNLRSAPGVPTINGFAHFATNEQGYAAMANLLQSYPAKHNADTLSKIINTYSPASDHNDDATYISNVAKWSGLDPNQKLNLNDPSTLTKLISAMVRQEHGTRITPADVGQEVASGRGQPSSINGTDMKALIKALSRQTNNVAKVTILNKTGNNVAVSTNAGSI